MTAEIENLYLRGLRQIMGELTTIRRDVGDIKTRLPSVERGLGEIQTQLGVMNGRIDHVDTRMEALEKHAGLSNAFQEPNTPFKGPDA